MLRLVLNLADSFFYITTLWYVTEHYDNPVYVGILVAFFTISDLFLVFIGPIVDRINYKQSLFISIIIQTLAAILFIFVIPGLNFYALCAIVFVATLFSSLTYLIEETILPQIVETHQVVAMNSIFEISYKSIDILFNAISGLLISYFAFSTLYQINTGLFLLALFPLFNMHISTKSNSTEEIVEESFSFKTYVSDFKEGISFIWHDKLIQGLTFPLIILNFFAAIKTVTLPIYAESQYGGATFYGLILTAAAIGGISGNFLVSFISNKLNINTLLGVFIALNGVFWMSSIFLQNEFFTLVFMLLSYGCTGITNIVFNSLYQTIPPVKLLGRVNATVDSIITIAMPVGNVLGGFLIEVLNINTSMIFIGLVFVLIGFYYYQNKLFRFKEYKGIVE